MPTLGAVLPLNFVVVARLEEPSILFVNDPTLRTTLRIGSKTRSHRASSGPDRSASGRRRDAYSSACGSYSDASSHSNRCRNSQCCSSNAHANSGVVFAVSLSPSRAEKHDIAHRKLLYVLQGLTAHESPSCNPAVHARVAYATARLIGCEPAWLMGDLTH